MSRCGKARRVLLVTCSLGTTNACYGLEELTNRNKSICKGLEQPGLGNRWRDSRRCGTNRHSRGEQKLLCVASEYAENSVRSTPGVPPLISTTSVATSTIELSMRSDIETLGSREQRALATWLSQSLASASMSQVLQVQ